MNKKKGAVARKKSQLSAACGKVPVKFTRPFEQGSTSGYVVKIGAEFFLLAVFGDGLRFNGFSCLRYRDVRHLEVPDKHVAFIEAALRKRGVQVLKGPNLDITSIESILVTANCAFPLITIFRERINPDICHIGRVVGLEKGRVSLLEIDCDASWDDEPEIYATKDITRIDFGGDYEDALHLVGGTPTTAQVDIGRMVGLNPP
jgi:hypothetical protein